MGPAEAQNAEGLAYALELGAEICDDNGDRLAPVAMVLETYCRNAAGKYRCLELFASRGIELPDTPIMALHRGRIDLLEDHLRRDPALLRRTFSLREIYPRAVGCHEDVSLGLHATPLEGTTLLHMTIDFDEIEIAKWLIERGMDVNAKAERDTSGFGGHTPLFGCVVRQGSHRGTASFAALLLDHGADPNVRASLQKKLIGAHDETLHTYRDVTPLEWGTQFHDRSFVDKAAMQVIAARGGL
jgi:ankyrin repeat protein